MNSISLTDTKETFRAKKKESYEVECISDLFPDLKQAEIVKAIEIAGPFRSDIIEFIRRIHRHSN